MADGRIIVCYLWRLREQSNLGLMNLLTEGSLVVQKELQMQEENKFIPLRLRWNKRRSSFNRDDVRFYNEEIRIKRKVCDWQTSSKQMRPVIRELMTHGAVMDVVFWETQNQFSADGN